MSGIKKIPEIDLATVVARMKRDLPTHIEMQSTLAIIARAKYEALKQAGFTEEQALTLCKT